MNRVPPEKASSSYTPKAPLEGACQKLWKNFKMLPQTGKKVQQQLKSHLVAVNLFSPWDARRGAGSQNHSGGEILEATVYTDSFASLRFPSNLAQPQDARNANVLSRKALRSASCGEVPARDSSWHHTLERSLSSQVGKPEAKNLAEPEEWFPEEYRPPPPFAPGYC